MCYDTALRLEHAAESELFSQVVSTRRSSPHPEWDCGSGNGAGKWLVLAQGLMASGFVLKPLVCFIHF